jgi:hypothetical protein
MTISLAAASDIHPVASNDTPSATRGQPRIKTVLEGPGA